jgi:hypothetical protein
MPWRVWTLWILFLVRGSFYCAMMPLWEGWDEYAHFAWLQHWLDKGALPGFHDPVSREIDESMRVAPLAYELRWIGPPYLTHSQWWALPEAERATRVRTLKSMPANWAHEAAVHSFDFYEAQQPPLYYWVASVALRIASGWPLEWRVLFIRLLSMALASLAIPFAWMASRRVYCAALIAIAPGFMIDVSRVANDCLAIALVAILVWMLAREKTRGWSVGMVLGAALLTKAYLLALVPALMVIWWRRRRDLAVALLLAAAMAGWWYLRNLALGYSLSGWMIHASGAQLLRGVVEINWFSAAHVIAKSFLWFGGWSFLTLKRWMYLVLELGALASCVLAWKRRGENLRAPAGLVGFYVLAMAYGVVVYWVGQRVPNLPGWYLWPMATPIAAILVTGLRAWSRALALALGAIDVYGAAALLVPYYAGLTERNKAAAGQFLAGLHRLDVPLWLGVSWILATFGIVMIVFMTNYEGDS